MSWNYRVMRKTVDGETSWGVHEVFYDDDGRVTGWTPEPVAVAGDSLEEIQQQLARMAEAAERPPLEFGP
jgi:hypothetical protein